jgi:hypothetical protein
MALTSIFISLIALIVSGVSIYIYIYISAINKKNDEYRITEISADKLSITNDDLLSLIKEVNKLKIGKGMSNNVLALIERSNDEVNNLHLSTNTLIREYNNKKTVSNTKKLINFNIEFEKMQKRLDKLKNSMEEVSKLLHNTGKI